MKTSTINVRVRPEIKLRSEELFARFGISLSEAINIFLHQSLYVGGLPFELRQNIPSKELLAALEESERIGKDTSVKTYDSATEMVADILAVAEVAPIYGK